MCSKVSDNTFHKPLYKHRILRYAIIGSVCVVAIAIMLAYQNTDSKAQTLIQNTIPVKTEPITQTVQTIKSNYTTQKQTTPAALNVTLIEQDVHQIANQERQVTGVDPIGYDLKLAEIARTHSQDMAVHQFLSDNSYEGNSLNHRYAFAGYNCKVQVGAYVYSTSNENIAVVSAQGDEFQIAQHIVKTWLGNVADSGNIFDVTHKTEGIGVALTENKMAVYATEDFC